MPEPTPFLASAIHSLESYLAEQGRSPNTIKAFLTAVHLIPDFTAS